MTTLYVLDIFGTFVFAMSGCLLAKQKKLDLFGFFIIGFFTAVGGGTLRDLVLGNTPVFWLNNYWYFVVIVLATLITFWLTPYIEKFHSALQTADAIGLAVFTVIGINVGLESNIVPGFAILLGMVSAIFGGIFRDILCNEIPLVLHREIYATACVIGGALFFLLKAVGLQKDVLNLAVILVIISIRLFSLKFNISLPNKK